MWLPEILAWRDVVSIICVHCLHKKIVTCCISTFAHDSTIGNVGCLQRWRSKRSLVSRHSGSGHLDYSWILRSILVRHRCPREYRCLFLPRPYRGSLKSCRSFTQPKYQQKHPWSWSLSLYSATANHQIHYIIMSLVLSSKEGMLGRFKIFWRVPKLSCRVPFPSIDHTDHVYITCLDHSSFSSLQGLNILIPIVDQIKYVQSLKENAIDIPSQSAITEGQWALVVSVIHLS